MRIAVVIFLVAPFFLINSFLPASYASSHQEPAVKSQASASPINGPWNELGPKPIMLNNQPLYSGRITAIAINGSNPSNIYIGAAQGGVWKSIDGGLSWMPLTDSMQSLAIGAITFSPDYKTIYVGTGEPNHSGDSYSGVGIYKSTDGGKTWTILGSSVFEGSSISAILVNQQNPNRILVATTSGVCCTRFLVNSNSPLGIYLSNDGGISWTPTLTPYGNGGFSDLIASPSNPSVVYASSFDGRVWLSNDGGSGWSEILHVTDPSCSQSNKCRTELAISKVQASILFLAISDSLGDLYGIFKYDTSTGSIISLTSPQNPCGQPPFEQCYYDLIIEVDPSNPSTIYFGGTDLFRSDDGGASWVDLGGYIYNQKASNYIHVDQHAFAFLPNNPSTIFVGNDGGIWKSTDRGNTWTNLNSGLGITQFYSVAGSPDSILIGGSQDNGCFVKSANSNVWQFSLGGDGMWVGLEASNPSIMYCGEYYLNFYRSMDGGKTWVRATDGINMSDQSLFSTPYAQDPNNPGIIYTAGTHVYKTTNFAASWSDVSGPLGDFPISAIAVAPKDSMIVYLGDTGGNVRVSRNGGQTWQTIGTGLGTVVSIDVDPNDANTVYVVAGASSNVKKFSFSLGVWQRSPLTTLPSVPNVVKLDNQGNIYVGTDHGVYYSTDKGSTWSTVGIGLPNAAVYSLVITKSNKLIAATHGRGAWMISLPPPSVSITLSYKVIGGGSAYIPPLLTYVYQGVQHKVELSTSPTNYNVDPGSFWSVTQVLNGSTLNERWMTNQQTNGTATSSFTLTLNYYHQYLVHFTYNVVNGINDNVPSVTYYQFGSQVTNQAHGDYFVDAGSAYSYQQTLLGSNQAVRWIARNPIGTVNSAGQLAVSYYQQYALTMSYSIINGGTGYVAPSLTFVQFGFQVSSSLSSAPQVYWVDSQTSWSVQNPLVGSSSTERWISAMGTSGTANSALTISIAYYHQYLQNLSYSVLDGGSGYLAPLAIGTQFGSAYSPELTTTARGYWFDANGQITFTNPLGGSTSTERWFTGTASISALSAQTFVVPYYHQYSYSFAYTVNLGGTGYSAPTLTYSYLGASATGTLTTTLTAYWVDAGTSASSTNPLSGSSTTERWFTGTSSVSVSASSSYTFTYYHQFSITIAYTLIGGGTGYTAPTFSYNYLGVATSQTATTTNTAYWVDSGSSWSFTNPLAGSSSTERWQANSGTSGTITTTTTLNPTYYHQLSNTFQVTANAQTNFDPSLSWAVTGTYFGTAGSTICTISTPSTSPSNVYNCTSWADYNTAVSISQTATGAPANSRWMSSSVCSFTQTTGGNTNNCNMYKQWVNNFAYSITYGGTPTAPTLSCNEFGVATTLTLSTTAQTFWCDNGATASATNPISGATNERWSDNGQTFTISSGGGTLTFTYYHQFQQTLSYSVSGGGTGYTAPTASGTQFGATYAPTLTTTATGYWFDANGQITFTNPLAGSTPTERWQTQQAAISASQANTVVVTYYHQYLVSVSFETIGGGARSAPVLNYTYFGLENKTELSQASLKLWIDSGSDYHLPTLLSGSTSSERWIAISATQGKVSGSLSIIVIYQHQYYVTISSYPSDGGSVSPNSGWYNATQSLQISAVASEGWKFNKWLGTFSLASNVTSISVTQPINETAVFYPGLTITSGPNGFITYSYGESIGKVQEAGTLTIYLPVGTNVTLSASPSLFIYSFEGWQGAIMSKSPYTSIIVNSPARVSASFIYNYTILGLMVGAILVSIIAALYALRRRRS